MYIHGSARQVPVEHRLKEAILKISTKDFYVLIAITPRLKLKLSIHVFIQTEDQGGVHHEQDHPSDISGPAGSITLILVQLTAHLPLCPQNLV